ncbi:MAG: hypothetical protein EOP82_32105 [Variovorax sp.]|nr:MAG: hypothetical protein EOP82_32105 [Variovorax sp.]
MTVLTDIANAMDRYPTDETTIEIIDVAKEGNANDTDINELEVWKFKVRVTNTGHLDMTGVSLFIRGLNGATVSESPTPPSDFATSMIAGNLNPPGGDNSRQTQYLYFMAPPQEQNPDTPLIDVHINDWSSDFNHFFSNHTRNHTAAEDLGINYPRATYSAEVFPG